MSQIENKVVTYFSDLFCSPNNCTLNGLIAATIPHLVSREDNNMLIARPSDAKIKAAVFSCNSDSVPRLDGFGCFF